MITDKSVKELEGSRAALTVTIDGAAIEEEYAKRLQKYAKELTIPGFRKGKTPASVIERKFGDAIREEAVYEMIDKSLQEAVKELPEEERPLPFESPLLKEDDLVILCADSNPDKACVALGALRTAYGNKLGLAKKDDYKPLFVLDWPLFEKEEDGHFECLSNPFTRPVDEDLPLFDTDPTKIRSTSYDTVLNGVELSSGALRIHDAEIQRKVFELLGLSEKDIDERFGFLVKALKYGVPPEGGFGIGIERLAMELCSTDNVRDVVAFPKNLKAVEPMSQCPSPVPQADLDVLGIAIKDGKTKDNE